MNNIWQEYLVKSGAVLDNDRLVSLSDTENLSFSTESTYLCDLSNLGIIQASGEETQSFLHGQFTNDFNAITSDMSQLSSYCNPKGRMLSIFRVFKQSENYFLLLHKDAIEITLKKLNMFKLMAKVELKDVSDEYVVFGLAGPGSDEILSTVNLTPPKEKNQVTQISDSTVIKIPSQNLRYLFICKVDRAINIWNDISKQVTLANSSIWEIFDIQDGIPQITSATSEAFIPQMVNLELIDGVNFQKGCYPGQEIVARTHYLGKPNRRMYRIKIDDTKCPLAGDNVYSKSDGDQPVGKIVTAHKINENNCSALTVLRTAKENADDLHLGEKNSGKIFHESLPYSLDMEQ